jgi:hypothetical protein
MQALKTVRRGRASAGIAALGDVRLARHATAMKPARGDLTPKPLRNPLRTLPKPLRQRRNHG